MTPALKQQIIEAACDAVAFNGGTVQMEAHVRAALETSLAALRAEPDVQPVAWGVIASNTGRICQVELDADEVEGHNPKHTIPLYAAPQSAVPLTEVQIFKALDSTIDDVANAKHDPESWETIVSMVRAIEQAHGIKEKT